MKRKNSRCKKQAVRFRAAFFIFIFFFPLAPLSGQTDPDKQKSPMKTLKELISEAQSLTLDKERLKATNLLIDALKNGEWTQAEDEKLKESLNQLSTLFYTDQAQKLFELGESLVHSEPKTALNHYQEALALEPGHLRIMLSMTRIRLKQEECEEALSWVKKAQEINPYFDDLFVAHLQVLQCLEQWKEMGSLLNSVKGKEIPVRPYFELLEVSWQIQNQEYDSAAQIIAEVKKAYPDFPEVYYWSWKLGQKRKKPAVSDGQKYIFQCKNITSDLRRKYRKESRLCLHLEVVEQQLDGEEGQGESL